LIRLLPVQLSVTLLLKLLLPKHLLHLRAEVVAVVDTRVVTREVSKVPFHPQSTQTSYATLLNHLSIAS
jgi:hypothetical protein